MSSAAVAPGTLLSNDLLSTGCVEALIIFGFVLGATLLVVHRKYAKDAQAAGGRIAKVFVELQRKSFHMVGGCIICSIFHWGIKYGYLSPACESLVGAGAARAPAGPGGGPMDAGICFLGASLVSWLLEASRLLCPPVQRWYLGSFKGLVREKELKKAAGIAYFLPGALAAMLAAPSNIATLGILFLSIGDAAASIGTAAGTIPIGSSSRKAEGSVGCFAVCFVLGVVAGLPAAVAASTSALVTLGEVLAEVIGLDDNFVIPMLGVMGVRLSLSAQAGRLLAVMGGTLGLGVLLGVVVGSTTPSAQKAAAENGDAASGKAK